jgi:hypothetical protein
MGLDHVLSAGIDSDGAAADVHVGQYPRVRIIFTLTA